MSYEKVKSLICERKYKEAVIEYYAELGNKPYSPFHRELIYLKQLADVPFYGRDILFFRQGASLTPFLKQNLNEYSMCIDEVLLEREKIGLKSPLQLIRETTHTIDEIRDDRSHLNDKPFTLVLRQKPLDYEIFFNGKDLNEGKHYENRGHSRFFINENFFSNSYDKVELLYNQYTNFEDMMFPKLIIPNCKQGEIFELFPDQILNSRIYEIPFDKRFFKLWTTFSPERYYKEIKEKDLNLSAITYFKHFKWRMSKRVPDFTTITSLNELIAEDITIKDIEYTGKQHFIQGIEFYEINIYRYNPDKKIFIGHPFLDCIDEVLRESENRIRNKHGLPRIGEGWVSEVRVYNLTKEFFSDAVFHSSPKWISPQHLDIFIPSRKLAIEYQGKQHYESVVYFGGEKSYFETIERDKRKAEKCKANRVKLIYWSYDEEINSANFIRKLEQEGVKCE